MGRGNFRLNGRSWHLRGLVLLAVAGVAAAGIGFGVIAGGEAGDDGPPWRGDPATCRQDAMAHVHHPSRLDLLARCATISGTVRHVSLVSAFNDLKIVIAPDPEYRRYLRPQNDGVFIADVIATDLLRVPVPEAGSRITASGAWVAQRPAGTVALHPAYRIHINDGEARKSGLPGVSEPTPHGDRLKLRVQAPESAVVGETTAINIRADWVGGSRSEPAPKIRLFTELTNADGTGVRWQAARTNSLGTTTLRLVARHVPGRYTFTVYATPSGRDSSATAQLRITR